MFRQTRQRSIPWELIFSALLAAEDYTQSSIQPKSAEKPASAFNRLGQYTSSPGHRAYCYTELAISSLVASDGHNHPRNHLAFYGGMARLSWPS